MNTNKLKEAFRLFLPSAQFKTLSDSDFEKFEELLNMKDLVLSEKKDLPKTNVIFQDIEVLNASLLKIMEQYGVDMEQYGLSCDLEFNQSKYGFNVRVFDRENGCKRVFDIEKSRFSDVILLDFERNIQELFGSLSYKLGMMVQEKKEVGDERAE